MPWKALALGPLPIATKGQHPLKDQSTRHFGGCLAIHRMTHNAWGILPELHYGWRAYNFLEKGYDHNAQKAPGGWRSAKVPTFRWVNTVLGNQKGNLKGVTRWVSRVHLDRYLAEFQYRFNRRFDMKSILGRLIHAAAKVPPMPQRLLVLPWLAKAA